MGFSKRYGCLTPAGIGTSETVNKLMFNNQCPIINVQLREITGES